MIKTIISIATLFSISGFAEVGTLHHNGPIERYPGREYLSCQADLIIEDGRALESFVFDDCDTAMNECLDALNEDQQYGRYPNAYCEIVDDGSNGDYYPPPNDRYRRRHPRPYPPHRPPPPNQPPYYPPPPQRNNWSCVANDNGYEEHRGGHVGYGRSQYEAAENAINLCKLSHGGCYIASCESMGR